MTEKLKVDLHTHTSEDPKDIVRFSARELIDRARDLNFDAIAITNHDIVTDAEEITAYADENNILLIPGMEATLSRKHVVILNPPFRKNPENYTLADLPHIKSKENLILAPHPFFPQSRSLKRDFHVYSTCFDAIEFSHFYSQRLNFNRQAEQIAKIHNLPMVGTSDCHILWEFGTTYSLVEAEKDVSSILSAVKQSKIEIKTTPLSLFQIGKILLKLLQIKSFHLLKKK